MDEVERCLAERRYLKVSPLALKASVTPAHLYSVLKEDPAGTVRVGHTLRVMPWRARQILGIADEPPQAAADEPPQAAAE